MIFIDAWAWIALADQSDQFHLAAKQQHHKHLKARRAYVTSNFVLSEVINYLYSVAPPLKAQVGIQSIFDPLGG